MPLVAAKRDIYFLVLLAKKEGGKRGASLSLLDEEDEGRGFAWGVGGKEGRKKGLACFSGNKGW